MSTQQQIITNLETIASGAQATNYGTPEQADQINEAVAWIGRLWREANAARQLPMGPLCMVEGWLTAIAQECSQSSYFQDSDQDHLWQSITYVRNLQAVINGTAATAEASW